MLVERILKVGQPKRLEKKRFFVVPYRYAPQELFGYQAKMYLGSEHLLLLLARTGVTGVALPHDAIRQAILELNKVD